MNPSPNPSAGREPWSAQTFPTNFAISSLAHAHRSLAASMLQELGLFPSQELMLIQLWDEDGQSQKALGEKQGFDHSTIAKSVRRLENAGLVRREKSPDDGRVTLVFLTEAGKSLERRTYAVCEELEHKTVQGLTAEEQAQLIAIAGKILAHLE